MVIYLRWALGLLPLLLALGFAEHTVPSLNRGKGVRTKRTSAFLGGDTASLRDELHMAIAQALGAGHEFSRGRLGAVRAMILPMWKALAKNAHGRVDRRSLRYVVHRTLLQTRGLSILGLEPVKTSATSGDVAQLFTSDAPEYVKDLVEGHGADTGFSLEDAVATVAMLEELVVQQTRRPVERLFRDKGWSPDGDVVVELFSSAMEQYLLRWMMGNDTETIRALENNQTLLEESFEDWGELRFFSRGVVKAYMYERWSRRARGPRGDWGPFSTSLTIVDAQAIAGDLSLSFGSFWHLECQRVKDTITQLDYKRIGRVSLRDFYNAALEGEWRFSESRDYLRTMGALEESSTALGPQVIIANYLQGPSNCIISDRNYRVCCINDCEAYMSEIEGVVQAPFGTAEQLIEIVANITLNLNDDRPQLSEAMRGQLRDIASLHNGQVPLHSRLFLQWLHYVFPQDCQYPHKSGSVSTLSPLEYGDDYMASESEMTVHASASQPADDELESRGGDEWMKSWSQEEELLAGNMQLQAHGGQRMPATIWLAVLVAATVLAFLWARRSKIADGCDRQGNGASAGPDGTKGNLFSSFTKAHLV